MDINSGNEKQLKISNVCLTYKSRKKLNLPFLGKMAEDGSLTFPSLPQNPKQKVRKNFNNEKQTINSKLGMVSYSNTDCDIHLAWLQIVPPPLRSSTGANNNYTLSHKLHLERNKPRPE